MPAIRRQRGLVDARDVCGEVAVADEPTRGLAPLVDLTRNRPAIEIVADLAQPANTIGTVMLLGFDQPMQRASEVRMPRSLAAFQELQRRRDDVGEAHRAVALQQRQHRVEGPRHCGGLDSFAGDAGPGEVFALRQPRGGREADEDLLAVAVRVPDNDRYLPADAERTAGGNAPAGG